MISPYGTAHKCAELTPKELENTFFYPGPQFVRTQPGKTAQRHWDKAKETCIECPVMLACRASGWGEEFGVIGGTDQHERYLHRRNQQRRYRKLPPQEQAALRAHVHARARTKSMETISGETGLSTGQLRAMVKMHREELEEAARAAAAAARAAVGWTPTIAWPREHPRNGDAWLFREGMVHAGHYMAQTRDGSWIRMKFRARRTPVIRWFPAAHVDLRTQVTPVYAERSKGVAGATKIHSGEPAAA